MDQNQQLPEDVNYNGLQNGQNNLWLLNKVDTTVHHRQNIRGQNIHGHNNNASFFPS